MSATCPPGLYPKHGLPPYSPPSEKKVYKAIKEALPADWHAWHSIKLRARDGEEAEADFVIVCPGAPGLPAGAPAPASSSSAYPNPAILILEVKGGAISKKDGVWYQSGKPMDKAPRVQAVRSRVALLSEFEAHGIAPPAIGEIIVFPDQEYEASPTQGDLEGLVVGARDLPYLKELLPEIMKRAIPPRFHRNPSARWVELIHGLWCEHWPVKPNLALQAGARLEERVKLDAGQISVLSTAIENNLVLVHGGAGTGKTILAAELARREARSGKSVLFLTFTDALAFELAKELTHPLITVTPIGRLALERLREGGFDGAERYEPEFWERITMVAARWRSRSLWKSCVFATVIVDEAQDFGRDEWRIVSRCAASSRKRIWAFMDESQAFWENRQVPAPFLEKCTRLSLEKPYRCPPPIQALADAYLGKKLAEEAFRLGLNDGTVAIVASPNGQVHDDVGKEINRLLAEGFKPTDIAVISLRGRMFEQNIMHREELGGNAIVPATDERADEHIVCDTFLRFKGLERPAVVVTDLLHESIKYTVRMNIAVSRAMGVLRIVGSNNEIKKDGILTLLLSTPKTQS